MAKPSLAEALGGYGEAYEADHGSDQDAEMYAEDLGRVLGLKGEKAKEAYEVICAIVKKEMAGHEGGGGEIEIRLK